MKLNELKKIIRSVVREVYPDHFHEEELSFKEMRSRFPREMAALAKSVRSNRFGPFPHPKQMKFGVNSEGTIWAALPENFPGAKVESVGCRLDDPELFWFTID